MSEPTNRPPERGWTDGDLGEPRRFEDFVGVRLQGEAYLPAGTDPYLRTEPTGAVSVSLGGLKVATHDPLVCQLLSAAWAGAGKRLRDNDDQEEGNRG